MDTSNRLPAKKTLSQPDNLEWVRQSLADSFGLSLKQFCIQTCEHFGFLNSRGEPQIGNCALALRALDDKGLISLQESFGYKSSGIGRPHEPRCLDAPVPQPSGLPEDAGKMALSRTLGGPGFRRHHNCHNKLSEKRPRTGKLSPCRWTA